jgi:hypothetical protein
VAGGGGGLVNISSAVFCWICVGDLGEDALCLGDSVEWQCGSLGREYLLVIVVGLVEGRL